MGVLSDLLGRYAAAEAGASYVLPARDDWVWLLIVGGFLPQEKKNQTHI